MAHDKKMGFTTYLNDIGKEVLLSDEEERALAARIQQGDHRALDELVRANLTFVVSLAKQYAGRGVEVDDLVSEGNVALLQAAARYDGGRGKRFVAFAAPYIRQAMEASIDQQTLLYRVPSDAHAHARQQGKPLSMDAPVGGSVELSIGRVLADDNALHPDEELSREMLEQTVEPLLQQLNERCQHVVRRFWGLGMEHRTLAETAQEMGLKRERVRQIRDQAIRHICRATRNKELKAYLRK